MADKNDNKPYLLPTSVQVDQEAAVAAAKGEEPEDEGRSFAVEGNDLSAYRGTSPEYMTYASPTDGPLLGDGAEDELAKRLLDNYEDGNAVANPGDEPAVEVGASSSEPDADASKAGGRKAAAKE